MPIFWTDEELAYLKGEGGRKKEAREEWTGKIGIKKGLGRRR